MEDVVVDVVVGGNLEQDHMVHGVFWEETNVFPSSLPRTLHMPRNPDSLN